MSVCGGGSTVWYSFTPSAQVAVTAHTNNTNFDTALAAYTGTALNNLTEITCDFGLVAAQSSIDLTVPAGQTVFFRVGGFGFTGVGDLVFTVRPVTPPANDAFADAVPLTDADLPFSDSVSLDVTVGATVELGEPTPSCSGRAGTVWYSFTPSAQVAVDADATGVSGAIVAA